MNLVKRSGTYYFLSDGEKIDKFARTTQVTNMCGGNRNILMAWAAKQERENAMEAVLKTIAKVQPPDKSFDPVIFSDIFKANLGSVKKYKKTLEEAGNIGTQAHNMIEWTLLKELGRDHDEKPKISDAAEVAFMAFEDWREAHDVIPIDVEMMVYSIKYQYAGTVDLYAKVDGKHQVVDWKTGKHIYPEQLLQNVAYQKAVIEMGNPVNGGTIVRLPKLLDDPTTEIREVPSAAELFPVFLALNKVFQWWQSLPRT